MFPDIVIILTSVITLFVRIIAKRLWLLHALPQKQGEDKRSVETSRADLRITHSTSERMVL
jgi:hypothetical protein